MNFTLFDWLAGRLMRCTPSPDTIKQDKEYRGLINGHFVDSTT